MSRTYRRHLPETERAKTREGRAKHRSLKSHKQVRGNTRAKIRRETP
jgi:hypothetical protein